MKEALSAFLILICCQPKSLNKIKFIGEEIQISIDTNIVSVRGVYFFRNDSNQEVLAKIFYPFPIDEYHYYPESILVKKFSYEKKDSGIDLIMRFKPAEIETLNIFYQQKLKSNQARYILTTTKNWKIPLKQANFIIDVPDYIKNIKLLYQVDSVICKNTRKYFYLTKRNFMPQNDLLISW